LKGVYGGVAEDGSTQQQKYFKSVRRKPCKKKHQAPQSCVLADFYHCTLNNVKPNEINDATNTVRWDVNASAVCGGNPSSTDTQPQTK
jgi:hypothetical protein